MATVNVSTSPKRYFPFYSGDDTMPLLKKLCKVLTTHVRPSGYFGENITDSFYNKTVGSGETVIIGMPAPVPILEWHLAMKGTTSKFRGHLSKIFPELEKVSDKTLDELINDMRDKGR